MTKDENPKPEEGGEFAKIHHYVHPTDGTEDDYFCIGNRTICYADIFNRLEGKAEAVCAGINTAFRLAVREVERKTWRKALDMMSEKSRTSIYCDPDWFVSLYAEFKELAQEAKGK